MHRVSLLVRLFRQRRRPTEGAFCGCYSSGDGDDASDDVGGVRVALVGHLTQMNPAGHGCDGNVDGADGADGGDDDGGDGEASLGCCRAKRALAPLGQYSGC